MTERIAGLPLKSVGQAALANSFQALAAPGTLYGLSGYNSGPAQFVQLYDSAAIPAAGAIPVLSIAVPATSNFVIDLGMYGMEFVNGISVGNSSTAPVSAPGAADCQFFARVRN